MPTEIDKLAREHVESYVARLVETRKPNTAASAFRLQQFFKWALDEGEITRSPMGKMHAVRTPEVPVPVLSDEDLRALLKACDGAGFEERRDLAMLRLFIDSGMRSSELAHLKVSDIDFTDDVALVMRKGRRPRAVR